MRASLLLLALAAGHPVPEPAAVTVEPARLRRLTGPGYSGPSAPASMTAGDA